MIKKEFEVRKVELVGDHVKVYLAPKMELKMQKFEEVAVPVAQTKKEEEAMIERMAKVMFREMKKQLISQFPEYVRHPETLTPLTLTLQEYESMGKPAPPDVLVLSITVKEKEVENVEQRSD